MENPVPYFNLTHPRKIYENFSPFYSAKPYPVIPPLRKRTHSDLGGRRNGACRDKTIQLFASELATCTLAEQRLVSSTFARHVEDAFADYIGPCGRSPTSE